MLTVTKRIIPIYKNAHSLSSSIRFVGFFVKTFSKTSRKESLLGEKSKKRRVDIGFIVYSMLLLIFKQIYELFITVQLYKRFPLHFIYAFALLKIAKHEILITSILFQHFRNQTILYKIE